MSYPLFGVSWLVRSQVCVVASLFGSSTSWSWVGDHTFIEDKVLSISKSVTTNWFSL